MRISDWSSDVCSSDLPGAAARLAPAVRVAGRKNPGPSGFQHQEAVMPDTDVSRTHQSSAKRALAALNDALRTDTTNPGHNRIMMTAGVAALIGDVTRFRGFQKRAELLRAVRDYDNFDIDNDPDRKSTRLNSSH